MAAVHLEARSSRASLPTVPTPPPARAEFEAEPTVELAEEQAHKLTWCVDLGAELRAMSTLDLWLALHKGEVAAETRVWRLGREAWTPAAEVPELACAMREDEVTGPLRAVGADAPRIERRTLGYVELPDSFGTSIQDDGVLAQAIERAAEVPERDVRAGLLDKDAIALALAFARRREEHTSLAPVASVSPPAPAVTTPPPARLVALPQRKRPARRPVPLFAAAAAVMFGALLSFVSFGSMRGLEAVAHARGAHVAPSRGAAESGLSRAVLRAASLERPAVSDPSMLAGRYDVAREPVDVAAKTAPAAPEKPAAKPARATPKARSAGPTRTTKLVRPKSWSPSRRGQKRAR